MLLVSDVHGATAALRRVAASGELLCILGDLINFIDYRTLDGIAADVAGRDFVAEVVDLRTRGEHEAARRRWQAFTAGREDHVKARFDERVEEAYAEVCSALDGATALVIHGNVDRPDVLRKHLPGGARFVDGETVQVEGIRVGFAGGGMPALGIAGEVTEDEMRAKLAGLGAVDVLCTHVPPAVGPLSSDVIGGRQKGSRAVREFLETMRPRYHFFGDVHQPQATRWRHAGTTCVNVGYFPRNRQGSASWLT